jgi:tetratricopeptide (TPR) repeat protein
MRGWLIVWSVIVGIALAGGGVISARPCLGAEPAREFLQALRDRRYHDVALDYLARLEASPSLAGDLAETLLYERGVTLLDAARYERDPKVREQQLDQAHEKIGQFITRHGAHPLANAATRQMGVLLTERAGLCLANAEQSTSAAEKQQLYAKARQLYDQARDLFQKSQQTIRQQLEAIPKSLDPKKQAPLIEQRDALQAEYIESQLAAATIAYEKASTFKETPNEYRRLLAEAARAYGEIAQKYRSRLAGLYSVLFRGRCYQDIGDYKKALEDYEELLQQPDPSEEIRQLKTKALAGAMKCWMHETVKQVDRAIEQAEPWLADARQNEEADADWLAVRWLLSKALVQKAAALDNGTEKSRLLAQARKAAQLVSRQSGEHALEAKQLLAQLQGTRDTEDTPPELATYADAKDAGREALEQVKDAGILIQLVQPKLAQTNDPERKQEMQHQIAEAEKAIETSCSAGIHALRLALQLADQQVPLDELNGIRYSLCQLYYVRGDYFDAAVLGQFLAMRYPDSSGSRQAAQVAFVSFYKLYSQDSESEAFAAGHILAIAEFIAKQWPGQPETEEALMTLVTLMIQQGQLDKAEAYLSKIPASSRWRAQAQVRTGQALWSRYLKATSARDKSPPGNSSLDQEQELESLRTKAQQALKDGIEHLASDELTESLLQAQLSLAQIHLDLGQPTAAVQLLEDSKIGPLALANKKDPILTNSQLVEAIYKTALRATIDELPNAQNTETAMAKAKSVMQSLKDAVGDSPEGTKKLIGIYFSLARDLKRQMESAPPDTRRALAKGFETFLDGVAKETSELNVLYWVADSFSTLGAAMDANGGQLTTEARNYYERAAQSYQELLERPATELDDSTSIQVRIRLAVTWRRLENYEASLNMFQSVLEQNEMLLNVQVDAASTFQDWGATGQTKYYDYAIQGDRPNKKTNKNTIWGWARLASVAAGQMYRGPEYKEKYRDVFHEARYNIALSRYQQAMRLSGEDQKQNLRRAKTAIASTYALYPDMGGDTWMPRYDSLLRRIQKSLNEQDDGLQALAPVTQKTAG